MITVDGRELATRADLSKTHGYGTSTLERLWRERESNGHPAAVRIGGRLHWDAEKWANWNRDRPRWFRPTEPATTSGGDPGTEEIGPARFAREIGHNSASWVSRTAAAPVRPPGFPPARRWRELPGGGRRPVWLLDDARQYAEYRRTAPQPDRPGRPRGTSKQPYAYAGDPRLEIARALIRQYPDERTERLTERLQQQSARPTSQSSAVKIISAARRHPET